MVTFLKMKSLRLIIIIMFIVFFTKFFCFAETVNDTFPVKVIIEPVFSLSIETFLVPLETGYTTKDLLKPSKNEIVAGKNLNGNIDLGHLIARKGTDRALPLISEYKVVMQVHCETNHQKPYRLFQKLSFPITGVETGIPFPEKAFVCMAEINSEAGQKTGEIQIEEETPVLSGQEMEIYLSAESENTYLGNLINIYYWISDQQEDKVFVDQRSDIYQSTVVISMVEL